MTAGLAALFARPDFVAACWPDRPCHAAGSPARRAALVPADVPADPRALIRAHGGPAWLHGTGPGGAYDHDTSVDAATAVARFDAGAMMDLRDLQRGFAGVRAMLAHLVDELGLTALARASYCHAFVSPAGTGVAKHFDNREVIVVQVAGRKRWRLAANTALPAPLMAHVVGGPTHPYNLRAGAAGLDDPAMPADAETLVLEPGAALFVPRGAWHETHALDDSVSLSFGFRIPSWAEVFVDHARRALAADPAWTAPAFDVTADPPAGTEAFVRAMGAALARLRAAPPGA